MGTTDADALPVGLLERHKKRSGIPIAPSGSECVARGRTMPSDHNLLRLGGVTVGAMSDIQEKTQECSTSWSLRSHAIPPI